MAIWPLELEWVTMMSWAMWTNPQGRKVKWLSSDNSAEGQHGEWWSGYGEGHQCHTEDCPPETSRIHSLTCSFHSRFWLSMMCQVLGMGFRDGTCPQRPDILGRQMDLWFVKNYVYNLRVHEHVHGNLLCDFQNILLFTINSMLCISYCNFSLFLYKEYVPTHNYPLKFSKIFLSLVFCSWNMIWLYVGFFIFQLSILMISGTSKSTAWCLSLILESS